MKEWIIVSRDSTDELNDGKYFVEFFGEEKNAREMYDLWAGVISNVYLCKIIKKEESI